MKLWRSPGVTRNPSPNQGMPHLVAMHGLHAAHMGCIAEALGLGVSAHGDGFPPRGSGFAPQQRGQVLFSCASLP